MSVWQYRSLEQVPDLDQVVDLEIEVWQVDPRDAAPTSIMHALVSVGGLVVGGYDGERLVGLALAFPGYRDGKRILWSHMVGVHPEYQGSGIGFGLKQFQRTWALDRGYGVIGWTFDPLQAGNANFNLHRLGATTNTYYVNFYGEMVDGINAGLPSDRLEVTWNLRSPRVKRLATDRTSAESDIGLDAIVLRSGEENRPVLDLSCFESQAQCLVEIPGDLKELKKRDLSLAVSWRLALREVLQLSFACGYVATDFVSVDGRYFYIISPQPPWFLYVVECSDGSLYTGVTPDVERRLATHNVGKGASYTASRRPVRFRGAWRFSDRGGALRAESAFKRQMRGVKLSVLSNRSAYFDAPFVWFDL